MCPFLSVPTPLFIISLDTCNSSVTRLSWTFSLVWVSIRIQVQRTASTPSSLDRWRALNGLQNCGKSWRNRLSFWKWLWSLIAERGYRENYCLFHDQEAACQIEKLVLWLPAAEAWLCCHNRDASMIRKSWKLANSHNEKQLWLWNPCRKPCQLHAQHNQQRLGPCLVSPFQILDRYF